MKKQRLKEGGILEIPLKNGRLGFGRILKYSEVAFYDYVIDKNEYEINKELIEEICRSKIAFIVPVYDSIIKNGRWVIIGHMALSEDLLRSRIYFIQDSYTHDFSIYENATGQITQATYEDCLGLERAAVWEAELVEERLNDHFDGKKWEEKILSNS